MCEDEHLPPDPTLLTLWVAGGIVLQAGLRDLAYQQEYLEQPQTFQFEDCDVLISVVQRKTAKLELP